MKRALALAFALLAGTSAVAQADRAPTKLERRALERKFSVPAGCAKLRISTVSSRWARYDGVKLTKRCRPYASNGRTLMRKNAAKWHQAFAGSDIVCPLGGAPQSVLLDLRFCLSWKPRDEASREVAASIAQGVVDKAAAAMHATVPSTAAVDSCTRPSDWSMVCTASAGPTPVDTPGGVVCWDIEIQVSAERPGAEKGEVLGAPDCSIVEAG